MFEDAYTILKVLGQCIVSRTAHPSQMLCCITLSLKHVYECV